MNWYSVFCIATIIVTLPIILVGLRGIQGYLTIKDMFMCVFAGVLPFLNIVVAWMMLDGILPNVTSRKFFVKEKSK